MQQHGSTYFACRPARPWGGGGGAGSKGPNSTFLEYGHVAYRIKWNHECSNMVANILPTDPLPDSGAWDQKVIFQLFQNMDMLHIKLKGMTHAAACQQIFSPQVTNSICSEHGHVAYQIKWNHECSNMQTHILS